MARKAGKQPTDVEVDILNVLWDRGPSTLGQLHGAMSQQRDVAYSTTRKMTQVMRDKGLIKCTGSTRPLMYAAAKTREHTQKNMINELAKKVFGGNAKEMMLSLLSTKTISDRDLSEIKRAIDSERKKSK